MSAQCKTPTMTVDFDLRPGAKIVKVKPYRLSPQKTSWAQEIIKELKDKGVVRDSSSPFASPCVIVPKENGEF